MGVFRLVLMVCFILRLTVTDLTLRLAVVDHTILAILGIMMLGFRSWCSRSWRAHFVFDVRTWLRVSDVLLIWRRLWV
jgi:hypothetical protein